MTHIINQTQFPSVQVNLNSSHADAFGGDPSYRSWCYFLFREPIVNLPNAYQFLISLNDAEIPVSYYCINSTNNVFSFNYNGTNYTITLTPGNYSSYDVASQISSTNIDGVSNTPFTLSTVYDERSNKMFFKFINLYNTPARNYVTIFASFSKNSIFGFNGANDITGFITANQGATLTLQSNMCMDVSGTRCVFVKCMNVYTQAYDSKTKYSGNILGRIPMNQEPNGIVFWNNNTGFKSKCTLKSLSVVEIQIVDENNELINFNNIDWSVCIQIDVIGNSPSDYMPDNPFMKKDLLNV